MKKEEVDEAIYIEVKAAKDDDVSSKDMAADMEMPIELVNEIYGSPSYEVFSGNYKEPTAEKIGPNQSGFYKGLIARKNEENANLKEMRGWLMEQVSYLRKAVTFLEFRKRELEDGIKGLEKNLVVGIDAMEQLEENDNFSRISPKIEKRNR